MNKKFYERSTIEVAKDLLGKYLIRKIGRVKLIGKIVETEAYLINDPASRAYKGKKNYNKEMWGKPGTIFIYNVHNNWMFNIVTNKENIPEAVLIRAVQPIKGIDVMMEYRKVKDIKNLTNGPGKLTKSFLIDKRFNGKLIYKCKELKIKDGEKVKEEEIVRSKRIGITKDFPEGKNLLRFYIKNNPFVSRK